MRVTLCWAVADIEVALKEREGKLCAERGLENVWAFKAALPPKSRPGENISLLNEPLRYQVWDLDYGDLGSHPLPGHKQVVQSPKLKLHNRVLTNSIRKWG